MQKINREEFSRLVTYMHDSYGINLENKLALVEGRLWGVISQKGFDSLDEYFHYVISDTTGAEARMLVTKLTTNYTYFMREDQHYKFLTAQALPHFAASLRDRDLRLWSAGCSSGEEPYTTAMVLDEFFGPTKASWDAKILATDISPLMLKQAAEARYAEERLQNVPPAWKKKYFIPDGEAWRVAPAIKNEVIFGSFNLMEKNFPFRKPFHIIFCRNVMIYFDKQTRHDLVMRFYHALAPGGYLIIGLSETLTKGETPFLFVQPSIYRKGT
ncbi:MAG: chemotaxis protein CheR [Oscillospiraceae bacterium]|nr:chemotaxis protein CheR [Oscillospiraceae bacterium]